MECPETESSSSSEGEWDGLEEEISLAQQTMCLFCSEVFNSVELMFEHCHTQHMFDIISFSVNMGFDCYTYIKFINYVRFHKLSTSELLKNSKTSSPWLDDKFMKPHDDTDPLLTFDFESYLKEKLAVRSDVDKMITIPQSRLEALIQDLAEKDMRNKFNEERIDRMKEAAKTVLICNNQQCSGMNNKNSSSQSSKKSSREDEDSYYFSTYDHFAIHHEMLQDKIRTEAYRDAILKNPEVFNNKRVLDVGCGTAILSMFAAKAGASEVVGVDKSEIIFQAMDIVRENDLEQVIDLFTGRVEDMQDQDNKQFDIIISEWMGYFLLFEGMLDSVIYARDRFLAPGGKIFPDRCTLALMAVCDMDKYKEYVDFWDDVYGFKMTPMKNNVIKEANVETVKPDSPCSEPVIVKDLDLLTCQTSDAEFTSEFDLVMDRFCSVTALVGYFDCFFEKDLAHKVVLSTSPKSTSTHWKQTMFLLEKPVPVIEGEVVGCKISLRRNRRDPRSLIVKISFGKYSNIYYLS